MQIEIPENKIEICFANAPFIKQKNSTVIVSLRASHKTMNSFDIFSHKLSLGWPTNQQLIKLKNKFTK